MRVAIVNPKSADGRVADEWPAIRDALETETGHLEVLLTEGREHAVALTRKALKMGAETIIAVGGDGTVSEVVNGFFEQGVCLNPSAALGIVLRGTGGDLGRTHVLPRTLPEIAAALKIGNSRPWDVIRMELVDLDGAPSERYVLNIVDVGIGGHLADVVNKSPKFLGGPLTFFLAGLWTTFFYYRNAPLRIELDGAVLSEQTPHYFAAVANGTHFGGGMHIAPAARFDDGLFDVVLVGNLTLPEKFYFAYKLYQGQAGQLTKVRIHRGRHLRISSPRAVLIEADGELVGHTDAAFDLLPAAINVIGVRPGQ